jgi:tetratricopeptide (TPR) repeat protein
LLNKPHSIQESQAIALEPILKEFPYFQSAKVLRLKHLYNQDSFQYNSSLKSTAAFTSDRSVLFEFITSDHFTTIQNNLYDQKAALLLNMDVIDLEHVQPEEQTEIKKLDTLKASIKSSIENAKTDQEILEEKLEVNKPLEFTSQETHSFQEWLQLARLKPIERTNQKQPISPEKRKKLELIDKFIETNPKIPSINKESSTPTKAPISEDKSYLMTETLAKVYLEQKKYQRAIQAYEILILKYPEKSSLFANRISDIRNLQKNNS